MLDPPAAAGVVRSSTRKASAASLPSPSTRFEAVEAEGDQPAVVAERGGAGAGAGLAGPGRGQRSFSGTPDTVGDALQRLAFEVDPVQLDQAERSGRGADQVWRRERELLAGGGEGDPFPVGRDREPEDVAVERRRRVPC